MTRNKPFLLTLLLASLSLAACSGLGDVGGGGGGCTTNCGGGGTSSVSVTLTSSNPPTAVSIYSFKVTIAGITLKNSGTGATANLVLSSTPSVELMRLQSDSAFLGSFSSVTSGTYDSAIVAVSGGILTFLNNSGAPINNANGGCASGGICTANLPVANSPTILLTSPITVGSSGVGFSVNFNLANAISISSNNLAVNYDPVTPALSAVALPRPNSSLASNQLDLIEDFTGVVSLNGQTITVTSPTRGVLTATVNSNTVYDSNPDVGTNPLCTSPGTFATCVKSGQLASIDAALQNDGTLTVLEYEPLASAAQDLIEGLVVFKLPNNGQVTLIVTDKNVAAQNSLIGGLNIGDPVIMSFPTPPQPFLADTKGLPVESVAPGVLSNFVGQTTTDAIQLGQTIAIHPTLFVLESPPFVSISSPDTVTLRFSRFTSLAAQPFTQNTFNVSDYNPFLTGQLEVQDFLGTPGTQTGTYYDGVVDPTGLTASQPVAVRALFIENNSNSVVVPLFAAKVRKP